jgi:hypothetical protein
MSAGRDIIKETKRSYINKFINIVWQNEGSKMLIKVF